jgi:hypothetical protein
MWLALAMLLLPGATLAASGSASGTLPCRTEYVVPYADQCTFEYGGIRKDRSPQNLQNAFVTCDRAQSVALPCVASHTRQIHVVALNELYTAVAAQAEIAMFAGQYALAETLLREKLGVLDKIAGEARPGDPGLQSARASTEGDIADALAGQCTWKALASAGLQQELTRRHRYADLSKLLQQKASLYASCSHLAATPEHRAYVEYMGFVALEEGGRAAQAAGHRDSAQHIYRTCIDGTNRSSAYATRDVKAYLGTVNALCRGRSTGRIAVDQPEPIDADDGSHFKPLQLPKGYRV